MEQQNEREGTKQGGDLHPETQERLRELEQRAAADSSIGQTGENRNVSGSTTYETLPDQGGRALESGDQSA